MEEALVSFALQDIHDLLVEEGKLLCSVDGEVNELEFELKEMKYLLKDADRRRHESDYIAHWIVEIRGLAYRAEAAIEIHAARVYSKRRRGLKKLLRRYSCILKEYHSLRQLATDISDIRSRLAKINKEMQDTGLKSSIIDTKESSTASDNQNLVRKTFPNFEIDDYFVGKQDDLKELISLVVDDKEHRVISVWGMGGIGKTTIVKRVYNQVMDNHKGLFESFAWVCITQECQFPSVLKGVLSQLIQPKKDISSMNQVPQIGEDLSRLNEYQVLDRLLEIQRSKRCLIVLDDLWKTSHWEGLKHAFLVKDLQSKIMVTTRKRKVAEIGFPVPLGLLEMDDAWELLKKKAFPNGNTPEFAFEEKLLDKIGREMVQKCGYLALAICLLGGILRQKKSMREWESVNKNISAVLYRGHSHNERDHKIDGVLNLSYENLPYYLKPCFLFMGIFKEDEIIEVNDLYGMWIAQGMISSEDIRGKEETLMDIAELYLSKLASRSIVQVEIDEYFHTSKYWTCKLHDVVRELCLKIGKREDFGVEILEYQGAKFSRKPGVARHLAIHFKDKFDLNHENGLTDSIHVEDPIKHLRSLRMLYDVNWEAIESGNSEFPPQSIVNFKRFKFLRELVIKSFKFAGGKLPGGITNLVLLRCLRLHYCELDELPSSIRNLVYLDTLDLLGSMNVQVPNSLDKLFRLKHLFLPDYVENYKVGNDRLRLNEGVDELESLIGFNSLVHEFKCITRMKNLRNFTAQIYDNDSLSAIVKAIATNWTKLQDCWVDIEDGCQLTSEEELMQLFTCPSLTYLVINVELGKLPVSSDFISSKLVRLGLSESKIEVDPMGILGKLPCLTDLSLMTGSYVGEEMTCHASSFPRLKMLSLAELPKLRDWRVEQGAMPILSMIYIHHCPHLKMIPDGLSCISTLQSLRLSKMPELEKRVSASGEDFHKIRHVPSIFIIK